MQRIVYLERDSVIADVRRPQFAHEWVEHAKTLQAEVEPRLVDERALAQALRDGWIAGAGFDVLSKEPPTDENPLLVPELLALPNFLLTPHVAWASRPAMQALVDQLIDNIEAFACGEPQNRVA